MKSRYKLFFGAFAAGAAFRIGIPGLADAIEGFWTKAEPVTRRALPGVYQWTIALAGICVFCLVIYFNYGIFFKGANKGRKGLLSVLSGFLAGVIAVGILVMLLAG